MADMFRSIDTLKLLQGKTILFIGDSNVRSMYKDLVWFLQNNTLIPESSLKMKLEQTHANDIKVNGSRAHKGRDCQEDRSYHNPEYNILVEFSFITQCYSENVIGIFEDIQKGEIDADVIIMNSTIWDISRWGPRGVDLFKENMIKLMKLVTSSLAQKCMFLWLTALPCSQKITSRAFLVEELQWLDKIVRFHVIEANNYARQIVGTFGYDVLDLHYYMRMQLFHMEKDGIHYKPLIMRYISNLILTHCSLSWNVRLPGNVKNLSLKNAVNRAYVEDNFKDYIDVKSILEDLEQAAPNKSSAPSKKKSSAHDDRYKSDKSYGGGKSRSRRNRAPRSAPYSPVNRNSRFLHR